MALIAATRNTIRKGDQLSHGPIDGPVEAATTLYGGTIAVWNASGNLESGTTATGKKIAGVVTEDVANPGAAGVKRASCMFGSFWFANATAGDAVTAAARGAICYILDNQTVTITSTGRSIAGYVEDVDSVKGVLVQFVPGLV
jgi:hypothetical protein